jgi:hypothetical protein
MIKKAEIISILIEYGLSPIEADRSLDSVENFKLVIEDLLNHAVTDEWKPPQSQASLFEGNSAEEPCDAYCWNYPGKCLSCSRFKCEHEDYLLYNRKHGSEAELLRRSEKSRTEGS